MSKLNKIVYIEDEADIRTVAEIALAEIGGLEVKCCASGKEALKLCQTFIPDVFLVDVMMPEMDGPETVKCLRAQPMLSHIPVIFMTAKVQIEAREDLMAMGAMGVIHKPFDPMTLAEMVQSVWKKQQCTTKA